MAKVTGPTDPSVKIQPPTAPPPKNQELELGRNLLTACRSNIPPEILAIALGPEIASRVCSKKKDFNDKDLEVLGITWTRATKSNRDTVITYLKMCGEDVSSISV